jgi:hypothetical protein
VITSKRRRLAVMCQTCVHSVLLVDHAVQLADVDT